MWDRTNQIVHGFYHDVEYRGIIRGSRVKHGGAVQHTVDLLDPITVYGVPRDMILIEETDQFTLEGEVMV